MIFGNAVVNSIKRNAFQFNLMHYAILVVPLVSFGIIFS